MGWLIALGVLTLIAIVPIGVRAIYDVDGPRAFVLVGPVHILFFPTKKQEKKLKKDKTPEKKKRTQSPATKKSTPNKGGSLSDFLPLIDSILDFLGAFRRKLRVSCLEMKLILAGDDPADLAENYGKAWSVLGNLVPLLNKVFTIKKQNLDVECDFLADRITVIGRLDLTITIGRIFWILGLNGIPVLREFLKLMNKRKGGAKA